MTKRTNKQLEEAIRANRAETKRLDRNGFHRAAQLLAQERAKLTEQLQARYCKIERDE